MIIGESNDFTHDNLLDLDALVVMIWTLPQELLRQDERASSNEVVNFVVQGPECFA